MPDLGFTSPFVYSKMKRFCWLSFGLDTNSSHMNAVVCAYNNTHSTSHTYTNNRRLKRKVKVNCHIDSQKEDTCTNWLCCCCTYRCIRSYLYQRVIIRTNPISYSAKDDNFSYCRQQFSVIGFWHILFSLSCSFSLQSVLALCYCIRIRIDREREGNRDRGRWSQRGFANRIECKYQH